MRMGKETHTAKARQLREAQAAADRRRQTRVQLAWGLGLLVIVGLLVAIVVIAINSSQKADDSRAKGPLVTPANATASGTIPLGDKDAPVRVEVFLDYICPACGRFEQVNSPDLERLVEDGSVRVDLHPMNFLDATSQGTRYSTRAANAVATVADKAPDAVWAFHNALFARQPREGTPGLSDKEIADIAVQAGVPQAVADTFTQGTFEPWVDAANESANKAGVTGTPTVKIDDKVFEGDVFNPGPLGKALDEAVEKAGDTKAGDKKAEDTKAGGDGATEDATGTPKADAEGGAE